MRLGRHGNTYSSENASDFVLEISTRLPEFVSVEVFGNMLKADCVEHAVKYFLVKRRGFDFKKSGGGSKPQSCRKDAEVETRDKLQLDVLAVSCASKCLLHCILISVNCSGLA